MIGDELDHGRMEVSVLQSNDVWFGITYQEDRPLVAADLKKLHEEGVYPKTLRG